MEAVFKTMSYAADPADLTEQEQAHIPVIELPDAVLPKEMFPVTIKVGRVPHAMEPGHYIAFIDLYADETFVSRVMFTPTAPRPKVTQFLVLGEATKLRVVAFCNLDGFWSTEQWIAVG